jgi:hypothetical protein
MQHTKTRSHNRGWEKGLPKYDPQSETDREPYKQTNTNEEISTYISQPSHTMTYKIKNLKDLYGQGVDSRTTENCYSVYHV